MNLALMGRQIVVGVTGSIAAYKSADLVRKLREAGAMVRVVMSQHAKAFITPLTLQAVSGHPVHDDLFDLTAEAAMGHIELARWAEMVLIAPATADCMAKLTAGRADDLLTTLCLATKAPVVLAPAMNQGMWHHPKIQANVDTLIKDGVQIIGPEAGSQACGEVGFGRMSEPADIVHEINKLFSNGRLAGKRVVITAGPTEEPLDPIRYLSNRSSGKMGYALATAAREAGATVWLVSGPVAISPPKGVTVLAVRTAQDMQDTVMAHLDDADIFIAVAAVSDYRPAIVATQKIHKNADSMQVTLVKNPDIVAAVGNRDKKPYIVGFAAETEHLLQNARAKRVRKKMDMIVANQISADNGMGCEENAVVVITAQNETALPKMSKRMLASQLIEMIAQDGCASLQKGNQDGDTIRQFKAV